MSELPKRFIIPEDRIPKPWSQGLYNCCVAASITKVLEVINYMKTGKYVMLSKGYTYGRHSRPDKTQGGMGYEYAMASLMEHGTVPEEMFPEMDEIPCIVDKVMNHKNIAELDNEAEKHKIVGFFKFVGDINFYDEVKKWIYKHQMPLVGDMVGKRHCTVIVGWDGNQLLYQDHDGRDRLVKGKFKTAYYLDGGDNMDEKTNTIPFTDVKESDWFYPYVKKLYEKGLIKGVTSTTIAPNKTMTRAEVFALLCRALFDME